MTSRIRLTLILGSLGLSLLGCAHNGQPVQRKTVSTVSNQDMTGSSAEPDTKRMSYTRVSNEDALNQDPAHVEHEALNGHLNHGDGPAPALTPGNKSQQASVQQE
jgi:hypothetical protein